MTASVPAPAGTAAQPATANDFDLVESSAGWLLTITLTDRLREVLANGGDQQVPFAVRVTPNLVPGEPFEAQLRIKDPEERPRPR